MLRNCCRAFTSEPVEPTVRERVNEDEVVTTVEVVQAVTDLTGVG
jgi:hypothetical protein